MASTRGTPVRILSLVFALIAGAVPRTALAVSAACERGCGRTDVTCLLGERKCEDLLESYRGYMALIGRDVTLHRLPALYVELLQPHYPGVDLSTVRFGFSSRHMTPAITDCDKMYFDDQSYVDDLRNGTLASGEQLLYHELAHTEQCAQVGGRDFYAVRWWNELSPAILAGIARGNLAPDVVHGLMPMEGDAYARQGAVATALPDGLVRPVSVPVLTPSAEAPQPVNNTITWTAQASGGRGAIEYEFQVRRAGIPVAQQLFSGSNTFSWKPIQEGTHVVEVRARQANPQRSPRASQKAFAIAGAGGGGGSSFWLTCEEGAVLAGVSVRSGSYVDSILAVCVRVNADGTWRIRSQSNGRIDYWMTYPGEVGGGGGTSGSLMCAAGEGVTGLYGRSGGLIDRLGIQCGRLGLVGESIGVAGASSPQGPAGGTGGSPFSLECPGFQVVTSLAVRAGRYIDQVKLGCSRLCLAGSDTRTCVTTLPRGTICGLGHTSQHPNPICEARTIRPDAPGGNGNCPSGYQFINVCDLGAPAGVDFYACMLGFDKAVKALPEGLLCGYSHDGSSPRTCQENTVIKEQPYSCPSGYALTVFGDRGAPAGNDFFGCVLSAQRPVTRMGAPPAGLVCGLSHSCPEHQRACGPNVLQPDDTVCPQGYTAVWLGDLGAPAGQGQYFCAKQ